MKKYSVVEVSERQLEDLVRQAPDLIEAGLRFVDHQAFTTRGPLDVLLVDSGPALIVAELKVVEDDTMLVQGIDYYDYVLRNLDGFTRAYSRYNIDATQQPLLFLIAPSFSVAFLNRIKWIDIPIRLFTFQCIEFEDAKGELVPIYKEITPPELPDPFTGGYSVDERYSYITDLSIRTLAEQLVAEIQGWDSQRVFPEATKYDISIKLSGRVLALIGPRRKHFMIYTSDAEGKWTGYSVNSEADLETVTPLLRANFNRFGGGQAI
ncbi:MAG: hypothetical protein QOH70_4349 [Blastocatellia bacterium]|jgi:hypothetical protein|nr:hypothetical protein [Blastocatellia bacterium]